MKEQVIAMFYELKDAKTGEILESNMQVGQEISFLTGRGHIIEKLEEEVAKLEKRRNEGYHYPGCAGLR